jgi:hypothetical protein
MTLTANDKRIWAAWETLEYALRDAMKNIDSGTLRFLVNSEGNNIVNDAAHDELAARKENDQ